MGTLPGRKMSEIATKSVRRALFKRRKSTYN